MRVVDCHVHLDGETKASDIVHAMDANGVQRILLMSRYERDSHEKTLQNLEEAHRLMKEAPDRISGLAWLNPAVKGCASLAERALEEMGFSGIKIIPDHWFVYEERFEPFWSKLNDLSASVLFHTGILHVFADGSRFNHPVFLEKLLHYPRIRFAMAHLSWPWCDECLAVMGRMQSAAEEGGFTWQSFIDTTPGTPPYIRAQAVKNAVSFCGPDRLLFGSDSMLPGDLSHQKEVLAADIQLYESIGLGNAQIQRILSGTADAIFPSRA
jgi:predicted TIM-barrel fold metal-dependent hydrolase